MPRVVGKSRRAFEVAIDLCEKAVASGHVGAWREKEDQLMANLITGAPAAHTPKAPQAKRVSTCGLPVESSPPRRFHGPFRPLAINITCLLATTYATHRAGRSSWHAGCKTRRRERGWSWEPSGHHENPSFHTHRRSAPRPVLDEKSAGLPRRFFLLRRGAQVQARQYAFAAGGGAVPPCAGRH